MKCASGCRKTGCGWSCFDVICYICVMKLHIFNPENDMALASGSPGYTPPANIRAYRKQHWNLPQLWAAPEDIVWDGESSLAHLFREDKMAPEICPWGWSPALVHELELAGVPRRFMPDREWLLRLRQLSSRESTVSVQRSLGVDASVCCNIAEIEQCVEKWGRVIMKSPWSSSGKGLMQTDNPNWQGWAQRILRLQGSVVVEKLVERKQDFAMEFWMKDGRAEYMGMNLFLTDAHGHFIDNVQGNEQEKVAMISDMLGHPEDLEKMRCWYAEQLCKLAPWYEGPVGVDMLVCSDGALHPCIEINWRMTMGMACVLECRRFCGER